MKTTLTLIFLLLLSQSTFAQLADRDYGDLLGKTVKYFEAQTCGPKPSFSRVGWRGDCHTTDGDLANIDLTGGWHDAGDHVKFSYPMMQAVTMLSWSYLDNPSSYTSTGNKGHLFNNLRFAADFMIKSHPSPNKIWAQIALGNEDHRYWEEAEENTYRRDVFDLTTSKPGTDMACAMSAAFSALSMVFADDDPAYSSTLLRHARETYAFGDQYRGRYSDQVPDGNFYKSNSTYVDELVWGALWLYKATGESSFLNKAEDLFPPLPRDGTIENWTMWYADKQYGSALLLAEIKQTNYYYDIVESWLDDMIDDGSKYTPGGLNFIDAFFPVPLSMSLSYCAYYYAKTRGSGFSKYNKYRNFAFDQVNYALGDNPRNSSYVVGFGNNFPKRTHHRSAHSPTAGQIDCCPDNDAHQITGALIGGPDKNDNYENRRSNVPQSEMANNTNGIFVALVANLVAEGGTTPPPPPPSTGNVTVRARGAVGGEQIEVRYNNNRVGDRITLGTTYQEYKVQVNSPNGNFKVAFVNDGGGRDAYIDWLEVESTKRQAESRDENTGAWANGVCGGGTRTQVLHCNGHINFGTMGGGDTNPTGNIVVRAKGDTGAETMELHVNGAKVKTWTNVSTTFTNYTYNNYSGSKNIKVLYTNDGFINGVDKNLTVDKITVCGQVIEANASGVTRNGCGQNETLWCNGNFDFGTRTCNASARVASNVKVSVEGEQGSFNHLLKSYPNPASDEITVEGTGSYQAILYDMMGRAVLEHYGLKGVVNVKIDHILPGIYVMEMRDSENHEVRRRLIIE